MIFVTVGTQKFPFDRLLKAVDEMAGAEDWTEEIFAQIGCSSYTPIHYKYVKFLDADILTARMCESDLIITHGGVGTLVNALKSGSKVIAVPRIAKYGEHVNDHQLQILDKMAEKNYCYCLYDCSKLADAVREVRKRTYNNFDINHQNLIDDIDAYIQKEILK